MTTHSGKPTSSSKRVLITGGAGFVGSQLGYFLSSRGFDVVLLDNMSYGHLDNLVVNGKTFGNFVVKDARDPNLGSLFKNVDTVFHFAGIAPLPVCQSNPGLAYDVNTAAVGNMLETARLQGVRRFIFSSTSAVYENNTEARLSEDLEARPNLIYSMTKHAAESVCRSYAVNYGMDVVVTRFFNVYGPHQDFKRVSPPFTSYIARELALGRRPVLFNQTSAKRDYIFVDDVISLLCKMMESTKRYAGDVFNLGSGTSFSVPEIYERMRSIAGKNIEPEFRDSGAFWDSYPSLFEGNHPLNRERIVKEVHKNSLADITKSSREFDWKPQVSMEQGLKAVYEYAVSHLQ